MTMTCWSFARQLSKVRLEEAGVNGEVPSEDMDLAEIASKSAGGQLFDIKKDYAGVGGLLNGKYATSRSAGNFLAGYNAEGGTYFGVGISFKTFQKLAGALHIEESNGKRLSKWQNG